MEEYTLLRQFADSWMLLVLFLFFVGIFFECNWDQNFSLFVFS